MKAAVRALQYLVVPLLLLAVWQASVAFGWVPRSLVAGPVTVAARLAEMIGDGSLAHHVAVSLRRLILGFAIGATLGVLAGLLVAFRPTAARLLEPTVLALIPIPPIAWIPLLIILLGIGEGSKVALISIGSFCTLFLQSA